MRSIGIAIVAGLLIVICGGSSLANKPSEGEGICITISPKTMILSRDTGGVSVHTNLAIGLVDRTSLLLDGIAPYLTKADSLGHLVAKFDSIAVKAVVVPGHATLTLTESLVDETPFAASDTITVKQ